MMSWELGCCDSGSLVLPEVARCILTPKLT